MSEELDKLSVDATWGTFMNGMRRPGETLEQFADRVRSSPPSTPRGPVPGRVPALDHEQLVYVADTIGASRG